MGVILLSYARKCNFSFEFSPPKTAEAEESLWKAIRRLEPLAPSFVSVTYGAGGSTRERTHATVKRIVEETMLKPAAHLTCVGHSRREIEEIVRGYWDAGIRHLVALRGDMPDMGGPYRAHELGYASTPELIGDYLGGWDDHLVRIGEALPEAPMFVLARGESLGTARMAALTIKEASRQPTEGMSVSQFRHGPLEMARPGITIVMVAGANPSDRQRNERMRADPSAGN